MLRIIRIISVLIAMTATEAAFNVDYWGDAFDCSPLPKVLEMIVANAYDQAPEKPEPEHNKALVMYEQALSKYESLFNRYLKALSEHDQALIKYDHILCKNEQNWHRYIMAMPRYECCKAR